MDAYALLVDQTLYVVTGIVTKEDPKSKAKVRKLLGATDPAEADAGTIRHEFAASKGENAVHGSDAPETAREEIAFWAEKLGWKLDVGAST